MSEAASTVPARHHSTSMVLNYLIISWYDFAPYGMSSVSMSMLKLSVTLHDQHGASGAQSLSVSDGMQLKPREPYFRNASVSCMLTIPQYTDAGLTIDRNCKVRRR